MSLVGITTHEIIMNECIAQGIEFDDMYKIIRELLVKFNAGRAFAKRKGERWLNDVSKKVPYRSRFINMVENPGNYTRAQRKTYAWQVACEKWYSEKNRMVMDHMEAFLEGGKDLARIIDSVYMKGDNTKKTNVAMQIELGLGRTKYFSVKKDAIVLYGLLIWKYCKKRDKEDRENGIIDENGILTA